MLDLSRLSDMLSGLFSANASSIEGTHPIVAELLERAGIDPSIADGLSPDEVVGLLQSRGIDLPTLVDHRFGGSIADAGLREGISGLLGGERVR